MSIFYLGGRNEKVPPEAILPEMFEDRYFLPGVIHGGEDYLIRVYLNDAHCEDETSADNHQFEVDYITKDLITEARTIDPSLDWEFYQHLTSAENFCCCNDESGDFVSIIEAWPKSIYMTRSELVKWAEGKYDSPEAKTRLVEFRKRHADEARGQFGILNPDGTVICLHGGDILGIGDYWITDYRVDSKRIRLLNDFLYDVCFFSGKCEAGKANCNSIPAWDCPKFREYLKRKEYTIIYEEIIQHAFAVNALDSDDAQVEFGYMADEAQLDWSDGEVVSGQIIRVISPDEDVAIINKSASDWEALTYDARKIKIPLDDGFSLVAEKNPDPDYKEIFVYYQDLAIIGEGYSYKHNEDDGCVVQPIHGEYSVKVYSDPDNEDFQHDFVFGRHIEATCPYSEASICTISPDENTCSGDKFEQAECAYR